VSIRTLTTNNFDEVVAASDGPVLVEFRADWCGPCHQLAPVLARLASEVEGRAQVAVIDYDDHLEIGQRFDVMSLPTILVFFEGQPVRRIVGARGLAYLREALSEVLDPPARPAALTTG